MDVGRRIIVFSISLILVSVGFFFVLYSYYNPQIVIRFVDEEGNPVANSLVAIYALYPDGSTKIVSQGVTNEDGFYSFRMNMRTFISSWLEHERRVGGKYRLRIESVGLIYHIFNPLESYAWSGVIEISIHNPPTFSKSYKVIVGKEKLFSKSFNLKDSCYNWRHYSEVVDRFDYHGRFVLARFNTSQNSVVLILLTISKGRKWRARMWFGYSFSDSLKLSNEAIWSASPTELTLFDDSASYGEVAAISIELTFHYEKIYHRVWDPRCGTIAQYYEYRIWHDDVDFSSLADIDAVSYFGDVYDRYYTNFTGQGIRASDPSLLISFSDIDIENNKLLNIPILNTIYINLRTKLPAFFLPQLAITVDVSDYVYIMNILIGAKTGIKLVIYFRYLTIKNISFAIGYAIER